MPCMRNADSGRMELTRDDERQLETEENTTSSVGMPIAQGLAGVAPESSLRITGSLARVCQSKLRNVWHEIGRAHV